MQPNLPLALTYDDVSLIPKFSNVASRSEISLTTRLTKNYKLILPYIASCMSTVCEFKMAHSMMVLGGVGCIHRFLSISDQCDEVKYVIELMHLDSICHIWGNINIPVMAAVGATGDYLERAELLADAGVNVLLIDVAHGHHENVKIAIGVLKNKLPSHVDIMAGNVATEDATRALCEWGADGIRCNVGTGSVCTTRIMTGHGVPSITSIEECVRGADKFDTPVMADGGIRTSGDITKALAVGADSVMLGSLLAGTQETPGPVIENHPGPRLCKSYQGSASLETKISNNRDIRNIEGISTLVPFKGKLKYTIFGLNDGVRSGLSYSGCRTISEFQSKATYVQITNAGHVESRPHLTGL